MDGASIRVEKDWARAHPVPESTANGDELSLWNYPVAKSDLSPEHQRALRQFLESIWFGRSSTRLELTLRGHASDTGEADANEIYARERAQKVARFLISEGFDSRQVTVESVGAADPVDRGTSGQASARNRSVVVTRFLPAQPVVEPPLDIDEPPAPQPTPGFKIPLPPGPSTLTVDIPLEFDLPPIKTAQLIIAGKMGGTLKVKVDDKGGGWGGGVAIKDGKLTAKFEAKIREDLKAKVSLEPPSPGKPMVLKAGGEFKIANMDTQVGVQTKLTFLYFEFSFEAFRLPDIELGDVHISLQIKPTLKIEVGPGPAMLARLAPYAAGAAEVAAPIAGALGVTILIIGGTIYAIEYGKEQSLRFTELLALRSGIAARVAYEIIGPPAEGTFAEQRSRYRNTVDGMAPFFDEGAGAVNTLLRVPDVRAAKKTEWTSRYAADGTQDFTTIRDRVFEAIGKYENSGDKVTALATL